MLLLNENYCFLTSLRVQRPRVISLNGFRSPDTEGKMRINVPLTGRFKVQLALRLAEFC